MSRKIKRTPQAALSIKGAFDEFVVAQTAKGFSESTIKNYHSHFHSISKHFDIEKPFGELTQADIDGMIVSMRESGLATNSISSYLRVFKTFMNWSQQQGYTTLTVPNYKQVETAKDPCSSAMVSSSFALVSRCSESAFWRLSIVCVRLDMIRVSCSICSLCFISDSAIQLTSRVLYLTIILAKIGIFSKFEELYCMTK